MGSSRFESVLGRLNARIDWEKLDRSKGWRVDLAPIHDLVERLGRPDRSLRFVHVTGSKGKGSTSSFVAAGLTRAGHRVGLFTSPHVTRIHERIVMTGVPIGDEPFADALTEVLATADGAPEGAPARESSWFDLMTATALVAFRAAGLEWAVLEVGLGGRLDSTNVIDVPEVAIVTTIALEHTATLGDTHAKIAREKGGIVKPGGVLVCGCPPTSEAGAELIGIAADRGARYVSAWSPEDTRFEERNLRVARAALAELGLDPGLLDGDTVRRARLPGRMETRAYGATTVLLDGAHVAESMEGAVHEGVERLGPRFVALVAIHREKTVRLLLEALARPVGGACVHLVATTIPGSSVHRSAVEIETCAADLGLAATAVDDPAEALALASRLASEAVPAATGPPWVFATGSLYLVGAVRGLTVQELRGDPEIVS